MALEIHPLNLGEVLAPGHFLVSLHPAEPTWVPCYGYLITGGEAPVLVDTGFRDLETLAAVGFEGRRPTDMTIASYLTQHGLQVADIRYVVHTHAHIDHAGGDDLFPMSTTVCVARRELEFSVAGVTNIFYRPMDVKHLVDRLHTPGALRLFDVDGTYQEEVIPGVTVRLAGGHTPGSVSVLVETADGVANICGDLLYDVHDSLISPLLDGNDAEPTVTGNRGLSMLEEKRAIKKALSDCRFLLPGHDTAAVIEHGKVAGRVQGVIPGPVIDTLPRRLVPPTT